MIVTGMLAAPGCVERVLVVRSEPRGAVVYVGGQRVGVTPLEHSFHFYGTVDVELRKYDPRTGGYRAVHLEKELKIPWHQYFPLDLLTEFLIPWPIRDVHYVDVTLEPETRTFSTLEEQNALEEKVEEIRKTFRRENDE